MRWSTAVLPSGTNRAGAALRSRHRSLSDGAGSKSEPGPWGEWDRSAGLRARWIGARCARFSVRRGPVAGWQRADASREDPASLRAHVRAYRRTNGRRALGSAFSNWASVKLSLQLN